MEHDSELTDGDVVDVASELAFWVREAEWADALRAVEPGGASTFLDRRFSDSGTVVDEAFMNAVFREHEIATASFESAYVAFVPVTAGLVSVRIGSEVLSPIRFDGYLRRDGRVVFSSHQRRRRVPPVVLDVGVLSRLGFPVPRSSYYDAVYALFDELGSWPEDFVDAFRLIDRVWIGLAEGHGTSIVGDLARSGARVSAGRLGRVLSQDHRVVSRMLESYEVDDGSVPFSLFRRFLSSEGWHAVWNGEGLSEILGCGAEAVGMSWQERSVAGAVVSLVPGEMLRAVGDDDAAASAVLSAVRSSFRVRSAITGALPPVVVTLVGDDGYGTASTSSPAEQAAGSGEDSRTDWLSRCRSSLGEHVDGVGDGRLLLVRRLVEIASEIHREESDLLRAEAGFFEFVQFNRADPVGSPEFVRTVVRALEARVSSCERTFVEISEAPSKFRRFRSEEERRLRRAEDDELSSSLDSARVDFERSLAALSGGGLEPPEPPLARVEHVLVELFGIGALTTSPRKYPRVRLDAVSRSFERHRLLEIPSCSQLLSTPLDSIGPRLRSVADDLSALAFERERDLVLERDRLEAEYQELRFSRKRDLAEIRTLRREREAETLDDLVAALSDARVELDGAVRLRSSFDRPIDDLASLRSRRGGGVSSFGDMRADIDHTLRRESDALASLYWESFDVFSDGRSSRESSLESFTARFFSSSVQSSSPESFLSWVERSGIVREPFVDLLVVERAENVATHRVLAVLPYVRSMLVLGDLTRFEERSVQFPFLDKCRRSDRFSTDGSSSLEFSVVVQP